MRCLPAILIVSLLILAGCQESTTYRCGSLICPVGLVCSPDETACVPEELVAACAGKEEGAPCVAPLVDNGVCEDGLCRDTKCGDGLVDLDEVCDDGNRASGDGCSADCSSDETCGNGILDASTGESCDPGSESVPSGCNERCQFEGCGNGELEEARGEVCDDGNVASGDGCRSDCRKVESCGDGVVDQGEDCDDGNDNPADACHKCLGTRWSATVLAAASEGAAESIVMDGVYSVALDGKGRLYVTDSQNHRVMQVDMATGAIRQFAGTGTQGFGGDGGPATAAQLSQPRGVAVDTLGNVYISDTLNWRVRRVDALTGNIETICGDGGLTEENVPAALSSCPSPHGLFVDPLGNLYVALAGDNRIRRIDYSTGNIVTVAGNGTSGFSGDTGPAVDAQLDGPRGVAAAPDGTVYIADTKNSRLRVVDPQGVISTLAGNGSFLPKSTDPITTTDAIGNPEAVRIGPEGWVYFSDPFGDSVRRIDPETNLIEVVAGTLAASGDSGDGADATLAEMNGTRGFVHDDEGNLYVADTFNDRVRFVDGATGIIEHFAGAGPNTLEARRASSSLLKQPNALAWDEDGQLLVSEKQGYQISALDLEADRLTPVAGRGAYNDDGDGGDALLAGITQVEDIDVDAQGNLLIATSNGIRRVDVVTGDIDTFATSSGTDSGDGGPLDLARFGRTLGVATAPTGEIYVADTEHHRIRVIDGSLQVAAYAGTGTQGNSGNGASALSAEFDSPQHMVVAPSGDLYIADAGNHSVRVVLKNSGDVQLVAGTGSEGYSGDLGPATSTALSYPRGLALDAAGNLFIVDSGNHRIRRVDAVSGQMTTVAGDSTEALSGDGGPATSASLNQPQSIEVDAEGNLFVAAVGSNAIRRVDAETGVITTISGRPRAVALGGLGDETTRIASPGALATSSDLTFIAGGATGVVQIIAQEARELIGAVGRYPQQSPTGDLAVYRDESFGDVHGVAFDEARGHLYLSESTRFASTSNIYRVSIVEPDDPLTWTIEAMFSGVTGAADGNRNDAQFNSPRGLFFRDDVLYVADTGNNAIRAVSLADGLNQLSVTTIAGATGAPGSAGDGGPALRALFYQPESVTACADGDLYVSDRGNHRVRRLDPNGVVTTVIGVGVASSGGEGSPAWQFSIDSPAQLSCDNFGNLLASSSRTLRLLVANDEPPITGDEPVLTRFGAGRIDPDLESSLECVQGVAAVGNRRLLLTDRCRELFIELERR